MPVTTAAPSTANTPSPPAGPRPKYEPLGYVEGARGHRRYVVRSGDRVLIRRGGEMMCLEFLLTVYQDPHHWRMLFPRGSRKVDTQAAVAWFVRECTRAGPYEPPGTPACPAGGETAHII